MEKENDIIHKEVRSLHQKKQWEKGSTNEKQSREGDNSGKCSPNSPMSFLEVLVDLDQGLSSLFAVCATRDSSAGHMRPFMKLLEYTCHGIPWLICVAYWLITTHNKVLHEKLTNFFALLVLDCAVVGVIKLIFRRKRPAINQNDMLTLPVDQYSFPSGHSTRAALVMMFILQQFTIPIPWDNTILFWSLAVTLSRVALGRHHVFDVLCGYILGIAEYHFMLEYLWIPADVCENIIAPIQEELHL